MKKSYCFFIILLFSISCKEAYNVPTSSPATGYLVVEGYINNGTEPTSITLTRTTKLYDTADIIYEHNAQVNIEGENNEVFPLTESNFGVYLSGQLSLNSNEKYRLHIVTQNGKEYRSDFAAVKSTPPIDSVSWQRDNGVHIYINTHDPQNKTIYYQWKYEETWEIHSTYQSSLVYVIDPVKGVPIGVTYRFQNQEVDTTIYKCWRNINSTSITLGSSEKLSEDRIFLPFIYIEPASEKLSVLYSVNLRQYALSKEAYSFFSKVKKNTEQLGSIFDAQPSELQGNIHCISNPNETVVGFVEVSHEQKQRIFISRKDVPDWGYNQGCYAYEVDNNADSIAAHGLGLSPTYPSKYGPFGEILKFYATEPRCMDCTIRGTNVRPSFWP